MANLSSYESNKRPPLHRSRDINELILGSQAGLDGTMHSVDYAPSEADSLLDEEILEQIYRINRVAATSPLKKAILTDIEDKNLETFWLPKNGSIQLEVVEIILPRKKGRPPC